MNKKDCLLKIRSRKLLSVVETTDNHEITLVIKLGDKVVKQSQFDILLAKMDEGFNKVNHRLDKVETRLDVIETRLTNVETILKKHDDLFVEHGWLNKSSFE